MMQNNNIWALSKTNHVYWAEWEGDNEAVLYIQSTGETTIVSLLSIELLETISGKPQTLNSLMTSLSGCTEDNIEENELLTAVTSTLAQLQRFGAIELCQR